jgi:threonine/homoserine/homoserine lactone efflux protein
VSDSAYVLVAGAVGRRLHNSRRVPSRLGQLSGVVYIGLGLSAALTGPGHSRGSHA